MENVKNAIEGEDSWQPARNVKYIRNHLRYNAAGTSEWHFDM